MKIFIAVLLVPLSTIALAGEVVPKDVQAFIRNAESCEHFAGEFDSDLGEARKKEIERSVVKYCQRAQKQLKKLTAQYKSDARVTDILRSHTNESVISFK